MQNLNLEDGRTALVIVAHPDDETIWLGGTISKYPRVRWAIFSLCRASDADRAPKFQTVCAHYNAQAIITDLDDDDNLSRAQSLIQIKQFITGRINQPMDYLFTHGANGEYGHPRHREIHQAVFDLLSHQQLVAKSAFCFHYQKQDTRAEFSTMQPQANPDYLITLTDKEFQDKKQVMSQLYGFLPNGPDINYCTNPEALKIMKY